VLWRANRERFHGYAAMTVALTLAAFLTYWLYPAQPPWLYDARVDRIVPAVWDHLGVGTMQSVYEDDRLVNTVAAMPSLHAAYPAMLAFFFWRGAHRAVRAGLVLYTLAMAFALVYGGEHFVADILAGWLMAGAAYAATAAAHVRRYASAERKSSALASSPPGWPRIAAMRSANRP
jgi:membrane-associated phospholipid phosphatase